VIFLFEDFSIKDTFVEKYGLVILVGVIGTTLLMIFGLKWLKQRSVKREMHKNKKASLQVSSMQRQERILRKFSVESLSLNNIN
jgi:hypothetical protein